jgi:hypothetical protein
VWILFLLAVTALPDPQIQEQPEIKTIAVVPLPDARLALAKTGTAEEKGGWSWDKPRPAFAPRAAPGHGPVNREKW